MSMHPLTRELRDAARRGAGDEIGPLWDRIFRSNTHLADRRGITDAFCLCAEGAEEQMHDGLARMIGDRIGAMHINHILVHAGSEPARIKMASLACAAGFDFALLRKVRIHTPFCRHVGILTSLSGSAHARLRRHQLEPDPLSMFSRPAWGIFYGHDWAAFPGQRKILGRVREAVRLAG